MKKIFFFLITLLAAAGVSAEPYSMVVGTTQYALEENGTSEFCNGNCHEYKALGITLVQGDLITFFDNGQNVGWAITNLESYGAYENFSSSSEGITCNVAGTYDFYFKLEFQNDRVYIEASQNQGGQGGGDQGGQGGGATGQLYYYLKESGMGSPSADELFENGILADYNVVATDVSGKCYFFLIVSNTEGSAIGQQYMAKAYVDGGTSAQFFPDGVSNYEKWGLVPGTYTFYLYKDEGDSYTISTQPIPGRTVVDADNGGGQGGQGGENAVDNVYILDTDAPMYNILGVPVDENYRGVVIQNGHKFMR